MNAYNKHMFPSSGIPWGSLPDYRQAAWNIIEGASVQEYAAAIRQEMNKQ